LFIPLQDAEGKSLFAFELLEESRAAEVELATG
jgi:hypothetical protein